MVRQLCNADTKRCFVLLVGAILLGGNLHAFGAENHGGTDVGLRWLVHLKSRNPVTLAASDSTQALGSLDQGHTAEPPQKLGSPARNVESNLHANVEAVGQDAVSNISELPRLADAQPQLGEIPQKYVVAQSQEANQTTTTFDKTRAAPSPRYSPKSQIQPVVFFEEQFEAPLRAPVGEDFESAAPPSEHSLLRQPEESSIEREPIDSIEEVVLLLVDTPLGYSGPSGILPSEVQTDSHFVPMEDRWRIGFPDWDRYDRDFPLGQDYPYKKGHWWDPYNQNVLKGDYPVIGQHTFLDVEMTSISLFEGRQVPTATTPFESTVRRRSAEFFGDPDQYFFFQPVFFRMSLFHGDAGFKPLDWMVRITPVINANVLQADELAVINPDVTLGTRRSDDDFALEEWFVESKIADLGSDYDFMSVRAGSQFFVSDFRGLVFFDTNRAVRLFGTRFSNRDQFNILWFDQAEKDTNSGLNTYEDRHQNTVIANYFRQDTIWPGYTSMFSYHYNRDQASVKFDDNNFLVRPDPTGVFRPHEVNAHYLGWAGDGHINRFNISHAFYWVLGKDELNPIGGREQNINAQMFAIELSYDRDYVRFRSSFFWASGDNDVNDGQAEGFDTIFDNPNFAGGEFSFWQRQEIRLFGVGLVQRNSLVPNLRSSKIQGQSNFVNPGLFLLNVGVDVDVTPKLKLIGNVNFLWFDNTEVLEYFTFQDDLNDHIGTDLSLGMEYRPFLNDNIQIVGGVSGLIPGSGFKDLYNPLNGTAPNLFASFLEVIATY